MAERVRLEFTGAQKDALARAARSNAVAALALAGVMFALLWWMQGDWRMALMKAAFMPVVLAAHLGLSLFLSNLPRNPAVRLGAVAFTSLTFACSMLIFFIAPDKSVAELMTQFWMSLLIMAAMLGATDLVTRGRWMEKWFAVGVPK
ncbi:MAG: hypothetical protein CMJ42_09685 [Phyllobacteriaceae bacterium]|nr:hypothetical protein [Phyllobacteriaceae bacterium]MBA90143.1 hypothetical protein [Phyllobacteriaceae bacterium]